MDLRQIQTFVAVAELGTVTSAAEHLRIAQPALSRRIAELEQEFGLKLFNRVGRRLLVSGEGQQLLNDCRRLLADALAIRERAQLLRRADAGILKVAASSFLIEAVFPSFLGLYAQRYPDVQVKLIDIVGNDVLHLLERGELHLAQVLDRAITSEAQHFARYPLQFTDMLAACHPRHRLGKGGEVDIGELANQALLQVTDDFMIRRMFDAACRVAGFEPNLLLESRAPHALLALAEAGHGVAIIPCAMRTHHYRLKVERITYKGRPLREPLALMSDKRRPLPAYGVTFCEMFAAYLRAVFPITKPRAGRRVPAAAGVAKVNTRQERL